MKRNRKEIEEDVKTALERMYEDGEGDDLIGTYLAREKGYSEAAAWRLFEKVTKYEDIRQEFVHWLRTRNYEVDDPVTVNGYNALAVLDASPELDGIGVFNVLVDLRDQEDEMMDMIESKFVVD